MTPKSTNLLKEYETKKCAVEEAKKEYAAFSDFDNGDDFDTVRENFHVAECERDYIANTICNYLLECQKNEGSLCR